MTSFSDLGTRGTSVQARGVRPVLTEQSLENTARTLNALFGFVFRQLDPETGEAGAWLTLARITGGQLFRVTAGPDADVALSHDFGRVPYGIFGSWALDGRLGQVVGSTRGGESTPSDPINQAPWTTEQAFVRATRSAEWIILLV